MKQERGHQHTGITTPPSYCIDYICRITPAATMLALERPQQQYANIIDNENDVEEEEEEEEENDEEEEMESKEQTSSKPLLHREVETVQQQLTELNENSSCFKMKVLFTQQTKKKRKTFRDGLLNVKSDNGLCKCILSESTETQENQIDKRILSKAESRLLMEKKSHQLKLNNHLVEVNFDETQMIKELSRVTTPHPLVLPQKPKSTHKFIPPYRMPTTAIPNSSPPTSPNFTKFSRKRNFKQITKSLEHMEDFDVVKPSRKNLK